MSYFAVNFEEIDWAITALEKYIKLLNEQMTGVDEWVDYCSNAWEGADKDDFYNRYKKLTSVDGPHKMFVNALDCYREYLCLMSKSFKDCHHYAIGQSRNL